MAPDRIQDQGMIIRLVWLGLFSGLPAVPDAVSFSISPYTVSLGAEYLRAFVVD